MKIVRLGGYTLNPGDDAWHLVEEPGEVIVHDRTSVDEVVRRSAGADIVLANKTSLIELAGRKMGIVGFGRIGRRVGELAHAFGMHGLAHAHASG